VAQKKVVEAQYHKPYMNVLVYINGKRNEDLGDVVAGRDIGFAKESAHRILKALYDISSRLDAYVIVETNKGIPLIKMTYGYDAGILGFKIEVLKDELSHSSFWKPS